MRCKWLTVITTLYITTSTTWALPAGTSNLSTGAITQQSPAINKIEVVAELERTTTELQKLQGEAGMMASEINGELASSRQAEEQAGSAVNELIKGTREKYSRLEEELKKAIQQIYDKAEKDVATLKQAFERHRLADFDKVAKAKESYEGKRKMEEKKRKVLMEQAETSVEELKAAQAKLVEKALALKEASQQAQ